MAPSFKLRAVAARNRDVAIFLPSCDLHSKVSPLRGHGNGSATARFFGRPLGVDLRMRALGVCWSLHGGRRLAFVKGGAWSELRHASFASATTQGSEESLFASIPSKVGAGCVDEQLRLRWCRNLHFYPLISSSLASSSIPSSKSRTRTRTGTVSATVPFAFYRPSCHSPLRFDQVQGPSLPLS
jgi:hypothetical protein